MQKDLIKLAVKDPKFRPNLSKKKPKVWTAQRLAQKLQVWTAQRLAQKLQRLTQKRNLWTAQRNLWTATTQNRNLWTATAQQRNLSMEQLTFVLNLSIEQLKTKMEREVFEGLKHS